MQLALEANTSSRHLSCIETSRAMPTRALLDQLAEVLQIPQRIRNGLVLAAGFAPDASVLDLDDEEAAEVRLVLEKILSAHEPYPAMVLDHNFDILMWNRGLDLLVKDFVSDRAIYEDKPWNMLNLLFHPQGWSRQIVNLHEIYMTNMSRAQRSLMQSPNDKSLKQQMEIVANYRPKDHQTWLEESGQIIPKLVLPVHYRNEAVEFKLYTTTSSLGAAYNITLPDWQMEAGYPVDEAGEEYFKQGGRRLC